MGQSPNTRRAVKEVGRRNEEVGLIINKLSEEGVWDSMKARDIPQEIINHVLSEIELGKDLNEVRRNIGIRSATSKEWQKISSAIKMGYRVNAPTYFHRLLGRNEKISSKLYQVLDEVLDADVEFLKENENKKGESFLKIFAHNVTPMIDALNRLQQGTVKIGKDLGVFADPLADQRGGGGVTIVVKSNLLMPSPEELIKQKRQKIIEGEIVQSKDKVPEENKS